MGPLLAAGLGVAGAGILGSVLGGKQKPERLPTMSPQQEQLMNQSITGLQGGGGPFGDLFGEYNPQQDTDLFNQQYRDPAYQQFNENIVPAITGQFRGNNLMNSTYAGEALGRAGRDVSKNLDTQMAQMLSQAQQANIARRQQMIQSLLGKETFAYMQPSQSPWGSIAQGGLGALGAYAGAGGFNQQSQALPSGQSQRITDRQNFYNQNIAGR